MKKLALPRISERIRGFTLPVEGEMYVFDYDEVFRISLQSPPSLEVLPDNPYDFEARHPDAFGVSDREPILCSGSVGLSYEFDPRANFQTVTVTNNEAVEVVEFRTLSGDWFVATLSDRGQYLVVAEPYLLELWALK